MGAPEHELDLRRALGQSECGRAKYHAGDGPASGVASQLQRADGFAKVEERDEAAERMSQAWRGSSMVAEVHYAQT
jgi:hypothetical protein